MTAAKKWQGSETHGHGDTSGGTLDDKTGATDTHPTLLLVDDTPVTVEIERAYFASVGFRCVVATSVSQVEDAVRSQPIDLVMVDVGFAREQGLATARAARRASMNPNVKILMTSVLSNPQLRKRAEEHGADDFLVKPAPRPKVLKEIKKLTSQSSRDNERVRQELLVNCVVKGQGVSFKTLDLSSDGMHLSAAANACPAVGEGIDVEIRLGRNEKPLQLKGTVVRHTQEGFGVRFAEVSKPARRVLDKFLLRFTLEHRASQYYL